MPEDVEFETPLQQELDTSAETAARVAVGPDIHCPYCGTRNPGDATSCSQCGGDLSEGARREKGKVVGAYQTGPVPDVTCPHCGASNPARATKCSSCGGNLERERPPKPVAAQARKSSPLPVVAVLIAVVLCFAVVFVVFTQCSSESVVLVQSIEWTYMIDIEELGPVTHENWRDEVPSGAKLGNCKPKEHHVQDEPAPNATEVCGTPYVEDTGTGQGKAVQDCEYHVYKDWCQYTVEEWRSIGPESASGRDLDPAWPALDLKSNQREGKRAEEYKVIFDDDGKTYTYTPGSLQKFRQFEIGSKWTVETNPLGGVISAQPAD
jgi:ribosomal protein L40E